VNESKPVIAQTVEEVKPLVLQENSTEVRNHRHDKTRNLRFAASDDLSKNDKLAGYQKTRITFFDSPLFVVEGISASITPIPGQKQIAKVGKMYIYESQQNSSFPVVYSAERKAYGYFTGEVIVTGQFEKALDLVESKSFEISYKNDQTGQIIFKVDHLNDLSSVEELKNLPDTKVEADVKFSRVTNI
jgi:hypothetical protein